MSLTPALFTSAYADGADTTKFRPSDLNNITGLLTRLLGTAEATGALLYRDSASNDGASWLAAAQGVLTCAGAGQVPAFSMTPTLTGLTVTGNALISGGYVSIDNNPAGPNLFIGNNNPPAITSGVGNLAIGLHALHVLTTGINNTAVGWDSQLQNVGGNNNTSLGEDALKNVTTGGDNNTAVGYTAGIAITTGDDNVAIAPQALFTNQTGGQNVAIGYNALKLVTTSDNIGVGYAALQNLSTGTAATAVGRSAGAALTTNGGGVFLGYAAGFFETGANKLFIDNATRANEADGRVKALIYGEFAATVAAQSLTVNGVFKPYQVQVDGTVGVPAYSAPSDPDTGFRWLSSGIFGFVANGVDGPTLSGTGFNIASNGSFRSASFGTKITMPADGQFNLLTNASTVGVGLDIATDAIFKVRTRAQTGYATVDALAYRVSGAAGISFSGAVTNITVVNGIVTAAS